MSVPAELVGHEPDPSDPLDALLLSMMRDGCVPDGDCLVHVLDNGVWVEVRGIMAAEPRVPGAVGAWLDALPRDRRVIVPAVISARLAGMLRRRGFVAKRWYDHRVGNFDDGAMIRQPDDTDVS